MEPPRKYELCQAWTEKGSHRTVLAFKMTQHSVADGGDSTGMCSRDGQKLPGDSGQRGQRGAWQSSPPEQGREE